MSRYSESLANFVTDNLKQPKDLAEFAKAMHGEKIVESSDMAKLGAWINSAHSKDQRKARKQIAFPLIYGANPSLLKEFLQKLPDNSVTLDSSGTAVVDKSYFYRKIDDQTPVGKKMQLINSLSGVSVQAVWKPGDPFDYWAPLPTFEKDTL